jgi:HK97 gp10 family phage protein
MAYGITVTGLDKAFNKIGKLPREAKSILRGEFEDAANTLARRAKASAPVDDGFLKNGISVKKAGDLTYEVISAAAYSAFMEFGTGQYVQVPAGLEDYASQFKGRQGQSGGFDQFFLKILEWVQRKRITGRYSVKTQRRLGNKSGRLQEDYDAAFMIALKILKVGVKPHPFFFIHGSAVGKEMMQKINRQVKVL